MSFETNNIARFDIGQECNRSHFGGCNHLCQIIWTDREPQHLTLNSQTILEILSSHNQNPLTRAHFTAQENARDNRT